MEYDKEEIEENIEDFKRIAFDNFVEEKRSSVSEQINRFNSILEDLIHELNICRDYGIKIECVEQRENNSDFKLNIKEIKIFKRNLKSLESIIMDVIKL